jgi:hypothetical protein
MTSKCLWKNVFFISHTLKIDVLKTETRIGNGPLEKKYFNFNFAVFGLKNNNPNFPKGQLPFSRIKRRERTKCFSCLVKLAHFGCFSSKTFRIFTHKKKRCYLLTKAIKKHVEHLFQGKLRPPRARTENRPYARLAPCRLRTTYGFFLQALQALQALYAYTNLVIL